MDARIHISGLFQCTIIIYAENRDSVVPESEARVQKTAVRRDMDICRTSRISLVSLDYLFDFQFISIFNDRHIAGKFSDDVHMPAVRSECDMTRAGIIRETAEISPAGRKLIPDQTVGAEICGDQIFSVRRENSAMHMRARLAYHVRTGR